MINLNATKHYTIRGLAVCLATPITVLTTIVFLMIWGLTYAACIVMLSLSVVFALNISGDDWDPNQQLKGLEPANWKMLIGGNWKYWYNSITNRIEFILK